MTTSEEPVETADSDERRTAASEPPASSDGDAQTSVVLPAYNEVDNIHPLITELLTTFNYKEAAQYQPFELVIVDDGSTDGTRERLQELAAKHPTVRVVVFRRNFGQSAAIAAGINVAIGEWIVTMDADRQNNPVDVVSLLDKLTEHDYDCVSGWRKDRNDPLSKTVPSAIQTRLARMTGPAIHDFGCTLKAYRASALRQIDVYGEGHRYIPAKLYKLGYRITEQPVNHRPRIEGETKYSAKRLIKGSVDLLFHIFWNRYSTRPIHFLGGAGFLLMTVGLVIGTHAVILKYAFSVELVPRTPRLILTATLLLFGFQLLMFGFLAEILIKLHYQSNSPYRIETIYE